MYATVAPADRREVVNTAEPRKRGRPLGSATAKKTEAARGVSTCTGNSEGVKRKRQLTLSFQPREEEVMDITSD